MGGNKGCTENTLEQQKLLLISIIFKYIPDRVNILTDVPYIDTNGDINI